MKALDPQDPAFDCGYLDRCMILQLFAIDGCPDGGYIEMNLLSSGTIVGYTNDAVPSMQMGDVYNARLAILESNVDDVDLTELTCY